MTQPRITLLGSQHDELVEYLESDPEKHERACVVLFRRMHLPVDGLPDSDRFLATEVFPFEADWVIESSPDGVKFRVDALRELFRRCEEESLVFGFIHNHPNGLDAFSAVDDDNERRLLKAITNRNGLQVSFVAMLWANHRWQARVRSGDQPDVAISVRHVAVVGERLQLFCQSASHGADLEVQARQVAAFGKPFADMLSSLRVGVVGCGGTGSPTAALLMRSGVGELVLIDDDLVESSNLNRLRGLGTRDIGLPKAPQLKAFIDSIGLSVSVCAHKGLVDEDWRALDALASCDVIFGCTDDQIGREVLNAAVYHYAQVLIDTGLGGRVENDKDGTPTLRRHHARISVLLPEFGECLFCQDVISERLIATEYARRENPDVSDDELRERYLTAGGEGAPGVGPFTSAAADFSVATFYDLIKPYRRLPPNLRRDLVTIDFVMMEFASRQAANNEDCPYCGQRGLLLKPESYRLNRPNLGKRDAAS